MTLDGFGLGASITKWTVLITSSTGTIKAGDHMGWTEVSTHWCIRHKITLILYFCNASPWIVAISIEVSRLTSTLRTLRFVLYTCTIITAIGRQDWTKRKGTVGWILNTYSIWTQILSITTERGLNGSARYLSIYNEHRSRDIIKKYHLSNKKTSIGIDPFGIDHRWNRIVYCHLDTEEEDGKCNYNPCTVHKSSEAPLDNPFLRPCKNDPNRHKVSLKDRKSLDTSL